MEKMHPKPKSLLEGNKAFVTKILSRSTNISSSFGIRHWTKPGAVPFKWEVQPGKPKDPPKEELPVVPATLPSPVPSPSKDFHIQKPAASAQTRSKFWKILRKGQKFQVRGL